MAKVEEIVSVGLVVKAELDAEVAVRSPIGDGTKEKGFVGVQAKVILTCGCWQNMSYIAVRSQVLVLQEVHGCRTRCVAGAATVAVRHRRLELGSASMGPVGSVRKAHGMKVVAPVGLIEGVGLSHFKTDGGHHHVPAFGKLEVSAATLRSRPQK